MLANMTGAEFTYVTSSGPMANAKEGWHGRKDWLEETEKRKE